MKFVPSLPITLDTMLGSKLTLEVTLIILEEAAQVIVCDQRKELRNMVCTMNLNTAVILSIFMITKAMNQESMSSTKVLDEEGGQSGNYGGEDEESIVSDKAIKIS